MLQLSGLAAALFAASRGLGGRVARRSFPAAGCRSRLIQPCRLAWIQNQVLQSNPVCALGKNLSMIRVRVDGIGQQQSCPSGGRAGNRRRRPLPNAAMLS